MSFTPARALLFATGAALGGLGTLRFAAPQLFGVPLSTGLLAWHLGLAGASFAIALLARHDSTPRRASVVLAIVQLVIAVVTSSSDASAGYSAIEPMTFAATSLLLIVGALVSRPTEDRIERGRLAG